MGRLLVPRVPLLLVGLLVAACAAETSVTTEGDSVVEPTTTLSAAATTPRLESTTTESLAETTTSAMPSVALAEIAGLYEASDPGREGFLEIRDDGTLHWAPDGNSPQILLHARPEGANVLMTDPDCGEDIEGVYQFLLLETGELEVVLIEDGCPGRAGNIPGEYMPSADHHRMDDD